MSVYDELMNEAPQSPTSPGVLYKSRYKRPSPSTQLSRDPARQAAFRQAGQNVSVERGIGHSTRASQKSMGGTHQEKEMQRKRFADPMMNRTTRSWKMAGMNPGQGIQRQAAGTTYEGPSLREKVEYLHEFLGGVRRVAGGVAGAARGVAGAARGVVGGVRRVAGGVAGGVRNVQSAVGRFQTRVGQGIEKAMTGKVAAHELARKEADSRAMYRRQHQRQNRLARNAGFPETPGDGTEWMDRVAAGTTYEGPSLREKEEYIRSFLESRTTRRKPHRRGDTGRGRNRASRTRMKPYVRNKRRRAGPAPYRGEQPEFGTVFPRDTEDAPTTDDSRQKNWNKRNNK